MTKKKTTTALLCVLALGMSACGSVQPTAKSPTTSGKATTAAPSSKAATLTFESGPSGPLTRNFNPFSPSSAFGAVAGGEWLVYEPLLQFNLLKPGSIKPWLAKSYAWSNGGKTVTFHLRSGVTFSNGKPFTASDVAFTFNLLKKYPAINTGGLPIVSASAPNSTTAVVNFSQPSYVLLYYIASTPMVPMKPWSAVSNPSTYSNPKPIGTGPYVVSSFSPEGIIFSKNTHYWQASKLAVAKINTPVYDSNTGANLALENGTLDWAGNFVSNIKASYVGKSPSTHHYWDAPTSTVSLFPNLGKFPLNHLAVRQAVADAVNRSLLSTDGEGGEEPGATAPGSLTGLILPTDKSYLTSQTRRYTTTYNIAKAKAILEKAGWKMGKNGYFVSPSGKPLAFTIQDPSAFTDYMTDAQIMASELKKAGMHVTVSGVSTAAWTTNVHDGNFQSTIHWSHSGPTPYYLYDGWLNSALSAPLGKPATGDYERFTSPQADALLKKFANTQSAAAQKTAIVGLEKIVATQLPVIPLVYGVAWYEYDTAHFTGWPTPSNPYAVGQPAGPNMEIVLLHLRPVS